MILRTVPESEAAGPVAFMARNRVAANLLMIFIVAAGVFSARALVQEVFPEFSLDSILVSVVYPGASPEEVEESIVRKIEEQIESWPTPGAMVTAQAPPSSAARSGP